MAYCSRGNHRPLCRRLVLPLSEALAVKGLGVRRFDLICHLLIASGKLCGFGIPDHDFLKKVDPMSFRR